MAHLASTSKVESRVLPGPTGCPGTTVVRIEEITGRGCQEKSPTPHANLKREMASMQYERDSEPPWTVTPDPAVHL